METVTDFIFGGSKITIDGDCSHEIKRCLFLGRNGVTTPTYIFPSITSHHIQVKGKNVLINKTSWNEVHL